MVPRPRSTLLTNQRDIEEQNVEYWSHIMRKRDIDHAAMHEILQNTHMTLNQDQVGSLDPSYTPPPPINRPPYRPPCHQNRRLPATC